MKKNYTKQLLLLIALISSSLLFSQTNRVKVTIVWPSQANNNIVEVYDPANNLLVSITSDGATQFNATYDLGCLTKDLTSPATFHHIKLYDTTNTVPTAGDGWTSGSSVIVNVAGTDILTDNGTDANSTGGAITGYPSIGDSGIIFNVNLSPDCNFPDTDGDGVIDFVDQDDDNDGILDTEEGLALNQFNCAVPSLVFEGGNYESGGASGLGGDVGAIYRFGNTLEGYDVLLEVVELTNTTILQIDDDTDTPGESTPSFLQSQLSFTGTGVPGVTYKFTIVDTGTTTPSSTIFRIGGTTWDCDGTTTYQESVRYYYPSAYGLDNPTSLTTDIYDEGTYPGEAGAGITAGTVTYAGFSTNTILRSYFQFLSNTFTIRMQLKKTTATAVTRLYAMSFTQCDIFEYKAPTLTIVTGQDSDGDGLDNQLDIDADNDGIPDNIEFQPTIGYKAPNFNNVPFVGIDPVTGIDTAYALGIDIEDTDGDEIPDFLDTDSDNDGKLDIAENGSISNSIITFNDPDTDGLDFLFDDVTGSRDVNDEITTGTETELLVELIASFKDFDSDIPLGGDLDYRDAIDVYFESATIDFDGLDDYVDSEQILGGLQNATIMAWVKLNTTFSNEGFVVGQDNFNLYINTDKKLVAVVNGVSTEVTTPVIEVDKWVHVSAVYANGDLKIYLNGEQESNPSLSGVLNASSDNFTIGKNPNDSQLFKGAIDEVRVFDVALTEDQLQQMVFQEIEENGVNVKGTIVPLDIVDFTSPTATVPWMNLQAYYPMTQITSGRTLDFSGKDRTAILHNITTIQPQTAPMPYETISGGDGIWTNMNNWLNGNVWDIQNPIDVKPWAIYQIHDEMQVSSSVLSYGLIIDDGRKLTVNGDNEVNNGWYFELNGMLDLLGDSQLIQTVNSSLVTDTDGKILRRQEGNRNYYWYNYWSSPVGATALTTALTTNPNTNFNINMIKDGSGASFSFTSAYDAPGEISNRWLYKFQNGQTYYDWEALTPSSTIEPGVGYTQKGISNASGDQEYIFEGKPNNGTILLAADDVDGDSANESLNLSPDFNYTSTLIGNPYPSAIDARLFIKDNGPEDPLVLDGSEVISGTVYVWEQWSGSSHNLDAYEGGYGTINYSATAPAYQWNDPFVVDPLAKTPTFFIPVAQGFFVEVIADLDNIEFNNSQRVFVKESDYSDLDPESGSSFFRTNQQDASTQTTDDQIGYIRLELNVSNGNQRSFVLAFGESATDGYDYGYDARTIDPQEDDLSSYLDGEKMIIQTFAPITEDKVVNLVFNSTGTYNYTIEMVGVKDIPEDQEIYLRDNLTNTNFDLRSGAYSFSSEINAEDTERFDIVFEPGETLSNQEFSNDNTLIYVNNTEDMLYVKGLTTQTKLLSISNMLGQNVRTYNNIDNQTLENGLDVSSLSSGVYLVNVRAENGTQLSRKVILD